MTPTRNRAAAAGAERRRPPNDDDPPERRDASPESEREAEPVDAASSTAASRRFAAMRASCALAASRADLGGSARAREDGEREEEKTAARRWCASYISRRALSRNASSRSAASLRRAIASEPEPEVPEPEPEPELESPTGSPTSPFFDDPGAASPGAASPRRRRVAPVAPPSIAMPPPLGKNNPPSRPPSIARRYASRDSFPGLGGSGAESAYVLATAAARRTATSSSATNAALAAAVPEAEANQRSWPETVRSARERDSRKSEVESEVSSEDDEKRGGEEGEGVDDFASAFASDVCAFASDDFAPASASASIFASGADKNSPPPCAGLFAAVGVALRYSSYSFSLSVASTAIFAAAFLAANAASVFSNAPVAVERSTTARVGFLRFASIVSASFTAPYTAAPPRTATAGSAPRTAAKEDEAASAAAATEAAAAAAAAAATARERDERDGVPTRATALEATEPVRFETPAEVRRASSEAASGAARGSSTGAMIPTMFRRVFR